MAREQRVPAFGPDGSLYVSDSYSSDEPGPGIWRVTEDGSTLWHEGPFRFANGLAFAAGGDALYVAETFAGRITRIEIGADGSPGASSEIALLPGVLPDGLALGQEGDLYVACYEPSQILRITAAGAVETVAADPLAHTLCHPTNVAFRDGRLLCSNLGRWHVTEIDLT
jgi:sugar lactone lactonase YvrE